MENRVLLTECRKCNNHVQTKKGHSSEYEVCKTRSGINVAVIPSPWPERSDENGKILMSVQCPISGGIVI